MAVSLALGLTAPVHADLTVGTGETALFSSATVANGQTVSGNIILNGGTIAKGYTGEETSNIVTNPLVINAVDGNTINTAGAGAGGSWLFSGAMSGSGSVTQTGGNQLHLMNADNSAFSGTLTTTGAWLSFRTVGAASKNATYALNTTGGSGIVFADSADNATYHLGMLTGTSSDAEVRFSTNVLGSSDKILNLVVGENNSSGVFQGNINNAISGSSHTGIINVEKAGTGTWTLLGGNIDKAYTGTTTVSGGVLQLGNGTIIPNMKTSKYIAKENGTLALYAKDSNTWNTATTPLILNGGTLDLHAKDGNNWFFSSPMEFNGGTLTASQANSKLVLTGNISGSAMTVDAGTSTVFFQDGGGSLTCKFVDVKSGTLIVKRTVPTDSTIQVNSGSTLNLGNAFFAASVAGTVVFNGGTLNYSNASTKISGVLDLRQDYTLTNDVYNYLTSEATIRVSGGYVTANIAPTVKLDLAGGTYKNPAGAQSCIINVSGDAKLQANGYNNQSGNITGTGVLNVVGPDGSADYTSNQVQITGNLNEFSGTLIAGPYASIGLFGSQASNSAAKFGVNGGLLFFKSSSATDNLYQLGDLFGNAKSEVRPSGSHVPALTTLEIGAALSAGEESEFAGILIDNNGKALAIRKVGAGTWTVSGNGNAYTGKTTVSDGCLNLLGKISSSNVTVENGGALAGSGTIGKNLSIETGGTLLVDLDNPLSYPLTVNGSVEFADGSIIQLIDTDYEKDLNKTISILSSANDLDLSGVQFDWS